MAGPNEAVQAAVAILRKVSGQAWLGLINRKAGAPFLREWRGERLFEHDADFVLPRYDAELDAMLHQRYRGEYSRAGDRGRLIAIQERIEWLGGQYLCWSGRRSGVPGDE
jgi:hypothetical protein